MVGVNEERAKLRDELLSIISTHKEGFASGSPESKRIDELIDLLSPLTPYPRALDHAAVFGGRWEGNYYSIGRLIGGSGAAGQGVGVVTSLKVFSMGRLPDVPSQFLGTGLEVDPETGAYNFFSNLAVGEKMVPSFQVMYGTYQQREENPDRFFVEFTRVAIYPADLDMDLREYCALTGIESPAHLFADMNPTPKLWSHVAYMEDEMRIQLGQLGGHYVLFKTDKPMLSLTHPAARRMMAMNRAAD